MDFMFNYYDEIFIIFGFILVITSYIMQRHRNFLWLLWISSLLMMLKVFPGLSMLIHGVLLGLFIWFYVLSKEKWWILLISVQLPAFILDTSFMLERVQEMIWNSIHYPLETVFYATTLTIGLTLIFYNTATGKVAEHETLMLQTYFQKAQKLMDEELFEKAIQEFNKAIKISSQVAELYLQRGNAYHSLNDYQQALQDYERAQELSPDDGLIYYCLAHTYRKLGLYKEALSNAHQAIRLNPEKSSFYYERARIYDSLDHKKNAIKDFNKAIELDPQDDLSYKLRGIIYYEQEDYDQAIRDFSRAIEIDLEEESYYYHRALAYFYNNDHENSFKDLKRTIQLAPDNIEVYNAYASFNLTLGKYDLAIQNALDCIKIDPEYGDAYAVLAEGYAEKMKGQHGDDQEQHELIYEYIDKALVLEYPTKDLLDSPHLKHYHGDQRFMNIIKRYEDQSDQ